MRKISTITISLPETLGDYVKYKVRSACYSSVSEYIRELIRLDQRIEAGQRQAALRQSTDPTIQLCELREGVRDMGSEY